MEHTRVFAVFSHLLLSTKQTVFQDGRTVCGKDQILFTLALQKCGTIDAGCEFDFFPPKQTLATARSGVKAEGPRKILRTWESFPDCKHGSPC